MNNDRYMLLGSLQHRLLTAVEQLSPGAAYGMSISRLVEDRIGRAPTAGALYTTLARLEARGLVRSTESEPQPVRGGRRRRLYELTWAGRAALNEVERGLEAMRAGGAESADKGASTPSTGPVY